MQAMTRDTGVVRSRTKAVGFWRCSTPLIAPKKIKKHLLNASAFLGADYGARTRHLHLGKVALYQMS